MNFDVYCDESCPDLLTSTSPHGSHAVIGSLWLESQRRDTFKLAIHDLRNLHRVGGEFKWQKVSPSRVQFYMDLIDWFFNQGLDLRFRCVLIRHNQVDWALHEGDKELGFYKFYYQMLHHWVGDFNRYAIFCDFKSNRLRCRLETLRQCLDHANLTSEVARVQAVRSEESVLIQLADVLTGAVSAKMNETLLPGSTKTALITHLESRIGLPIRATGSDAQKFNVFAINPGGGW